MTLQQLKNKIAELESWLKDHPNHSNYALIIKDKLELEKQLETNKKP